MPTLLLVHHTPSPALQAMFEAVASGARTDEIEGVDVVVRPALTAGAADVLAADGYLLGTPANIGYMSGESKREVVTFRLSTYASDSYSRLAC